jgi:hypothetical protein
MKEMTIGKIISVENDIYNTIEIVNQMNQKNNLSEEELKRKKFLVNRIKGLRKYLVKNIFACSGEYTYIEDNSEFEQKFII